MKLTFYKYEGAGNDFIILDNRKGDLAEILKPHTIKVLCDRHFGIGADGLMSLQSKNDYDFEMLYFNANGKEGTMCGNGGRCIVAFAKRLGLIEQETNFLAVDGPHYAKISVNDKWVSLKMIDVCDIGDDGSATVTNTGSPHYVLRVTDLKNKDVFNDGRNIRYSERYKRDGINVNFVEDMGDHYFVRTYERGVEDETLACGTGVTAVAISMAKAKNLRGEITTSLRVPGGDLKVRFKYDGEKFTGIFLEGPAAFVFEGAINV
ncbi:MAG: diaminopimelate epimerase [Bacteroidota bacterium]